MMLLTILEFCIIEKYDRTIRTSTRKLPRLRKPNGIMESQTKGFMCCGEKAVIDLN